MSWPDAVQRLRRERRPGVLVTVLTVRGHAPREAGTKMVVAADEAWGTIGGGNLEATALERAREMVDQGVTAPEQLAVTLTERSRNRHGRQCCGGEVVVLLEPLPVVPSVAVFGLGHVGLELARLLARHDLELHLVDSREEQLTARALSPLDDSVADVHVHHAVLPELVLGEVPPGTHVVVMTHDHAEDAALCDAALRCGHLGTIGLIGSTAKAARFRSVLAEGGHPAEAIARITCPVGRPDLLGLPGKDPATIALGIAVELLRTIEAEAAPGRGDTRAPRTSGSPPTRPAAPGSR